MIQLALALFGVVGGLGLFLYGMQYLSDALQRAAGARFRELLERLTGTVFRGFVVGALVTSVIQSSSATTVMVVGLVNAGLMTLIQAAGVIFGANVGTTITAQIVAFKLTDYALPAVGIGFAMSFFGRRRGTKRSGDIILGLGFLFLGMKIMSQYLGPMAKLPAVVTAIKAFATYPLLGVAVGCVLTAIVQSSSATTGLMIALAGEGALSLGAAIPLVLGANIGTCATALLASIGTSLMARRAAVVHLLFNVFGVLLALPFIGLIARAVMSIGADVPRQVANAHTLFNIGVSVVMIPLAAYLVRAAVLIVPGTAEFFQAGPRYLDRRFLSTPAMALSQARRETHRMAEYVHDNIKAVFEGLLADDQGVYRTMLASEQVINDLERAITEYLATLSARELDEEQSRTVANLLMATKDIERVGDHAESLAQMVSRKVEDQVVFSAEATEELKVMYSIVERALAGATQALGTGVDDPSARVAGLEDDLDRMEQELRRTHIRRLTEGACLPAAGIIFLDIASHFERIGDHAASIARLAAQGPAPHQPPERLSPDSQEAPAGR
ncbi:MAG: Na/Pi cotransporter family protein [Bacillota bacterium]|nr:Na/Pi cotransporter family protein [Bacillota bacterium]